MRCRRCDGKGNLVIRLGRPDPSRDTHAPYTGPWCVYPAHRCPVCYGSGSEKDKVNHVAWKRVHLDADGWNRTTSAIAEGDEQ